MNASTLIAAVAVMSMPVLAFAGGSHDGGHGQATPIGEPGYAGDVTRTIAVVMKDNYFEPEAVNVSPGETVRFSILNEGRLVHEFNIGTPEMHEAHQREMRMMVEHGVIQGGTLNREMMKMDMGNGHTMEHDDPNSVLLAPGETAEIVWTFSAQANLEFACNVPGHYQSGMYGDVEFKTSDDMQARAR
ncbi:MAG: plastocyanin/azurin family copper-binding protein [Marinobacter sp.]|uniref:cupredoxin domain-containing protein n=1 Tax=Marinobacter sp. TaxID=50741 RepID=UPI00299D4340|nr:plastocyanin/azurin family copper-binding protein [Marinobacter sp.]MDX1755507.1 plastocyanin/azurin family copper-binding protein [Marinobacter sp.]